MRKPVFYKLTQTTVAEIDMLASQLNIPKTKVIEISVANLARESQPQNGHPFMKLAGVLKDLNLDAVFNQAKESKNSKEPPAIL